ncbi:hypothetical protein LTR56_005638 [Elasticomyces elasticus]|nr:hypothetical protein LTR56_005638 [Elasticomyces elasticus]KAK3663975.1 hypothetical protein LTR22_005195 [Elasticomyces elasticus]KAK4927379.1 hypothetical protein LTR49_005784 [Elasticomyces elasticus]KAK5763344.1 hypothetical protein LTS12_006519 [Elasticomyces elasticus]
MSAAASCVQKLNTTGTYCSGSKFAADPDVAGVGVVSAFAITSVLACAFSLIYLTWQLWKWNKWRRSSPEEKDNKDRAQSKFLEATIGACNDQQILTGMAYVLGAIGRKGISCDISAYHWNIVADMALISAATFMVTVTVTKSFFENRLLGLLRLSLMLVLAIRLYTMSNTNVPYPIPNVQTTGTTNTTTLVQPAACFASDSNTVPNRDPVATNLITIVFCALILCVGTRLVLPFLTQLFPFGRFSRRTYRRFSIVFYLVEWPVLGFGAYIIGRSCKSISDLRAYIDGTKILGNVNPENNIHTFGQYIPLVLLALLPLTMLESAFDHYKEKRAQSVDAGFLKKMLWLLVLGPDRGDYQVIKHSATEEGIPLDRLHPPVV